MAEHSPNVVAGDKLTTWSPRPFHTRYVRGRVAPLRHRTRVPDSTAHPDASARGAGRRDAG